MSGKQLKYINIPSKIVDNVMGKLKFQSSPGPSLINYYLYYEI